MRSSVCREPRTDLGQRALPSERLRTAQSESAAISLLRELRGFGLTTFRTLQTQNGLITWRDLLLVFFSFFSSFKLQ